MPAGTRSPVLPSEFEALTPSVDAGICEVLVKFFKFQLVYFRWHKYAWKSDGGLSDSFKSEICYAKSRCADLGNPQSDIYDE
jgi:hypothetical protein